MKIQRDVRKITDLPKKWSWLTGFLGFYGFRYFVDGDTKSLVAFVFLIYFCFYFTYKLSKEREDERMLENYRKAKELSYKIPFFIILILCFAGIATNLGTEFLVVIIMASFILNIVTFSLSFFYYERYT